MYVSIDRENMQFVAKHPSSDALSSLANIESAHVAVAVMPCDEPRDFNMLTDLELRLLYRHTAGVDPSTAHRPAMLAHCVALAEQLPERELNVFEVEVQSNYIGNDPTGRYLYVPGATRPKRLPPYELEERNGVREPAPYTLAHAVWSTISSMFTTTDTGGMYNIPTVADIKTWAKENGWNVKTVERAYYRWRKWHCLSRGQMLM